MSAGQEAEGQGARAIARRCAHDMIGARGSAGPRRFRDQAGQAAPFDILHREIGDAVDGTDGMHRHDVRVLEQAGDLGLELKALQCLRVHGGSQRQYLEGNPAADGDLTGFIDDAHTAAADLAADVKIGEDSPRGRPVRGVSGGCGVGGVDRFELGEPLQNGQEPPGDASGLFFVIETPESFGAPIHRCYST